MPLIFSRRGETSDGKFTNKPGTRTGYFSMARPGPGSRQWQATRLSQTKWINAIKDQADLKDVVIHVHGYNTRQTDMLARHAAIEAGLKAQGYRGAVVSYDWPSNGNKLHYKSDLRDARATSRFLVEDGILPLLKSAWKPRVHLFAHSMGAFMVTHGLGQFGDDATPGSGSWEMGKVIFASGDADRRLYKKGAESSLVLERRTKGLTNFNNNDDAVLTLAVIINGTERVGLSGLPRPTDSEHRNISGTRQYRDTKPVFDNNEAETLYSHRWWFESDWFFKKAMKVLS